MADDYIRTFNLLYPLADYITLNVSCPNVAACDIFLQISFIKELIFRVGQLVKENKIKKNIFVKIGPDMKMEELDEVVDACVASGVTGIIATNLIKNRTGIISRSYPDEMDHPGGISGRLLAAKSDAVIAHIYQRAGDKLKIIGVGGIFSAADAYRKIKLGASALQVFTGFIYNGPLFIRELNLGLLKLLEKDGYKNISEVVGRGV
jgi:dihydroorotate dehydrogenase